MECFVAATSYKKLAQENSHGNMNELGEYLFANYYLRRLRMGTPIYCESDDC